MAQRKLIFVNADGVYEEHSESADSALFLSLQVSSDPSAANDVVRKSYLDQILQGMDWQESVLSRLATPPGSPSTGDRYLVIATATGAWAGHEDDIAEWNGTAWVFTTPNPGFATFVEAESTAYNYNGTAWVKTASIYNHNDLANIQGGTTSEYYHMTSAEDTWLAAVVADISASNVADLSDNESVTGKWSFASGNLRLPGAANVSPSAGDVYFDDTTDILYVYNGSAYMQIGAEANNTYQNFTAGTGGLVTGNAVYISGNDTVTKALASAYATSRTIGISYETKTAGNLTKIAMPGSVITGILTGAVAGKVYYLSASTPGALVATPPSGAGEVVFVCGFAKNATDLLVYTQFIKVNS